MKKDVKGKWRTEKRLSGTNASSFDETKDPFVEQGMAQTTHSGLVRRLWLTDHTS